MLASAAMKCFRALLLRYGTAFRQAPRQKDNDRGQLGKTRPGWIWSKPSFARHLCLLFISEISQPNGNIRKRLSRPAATTMPAAAATRPPPPKVCPPRDEKLSPSAIAVAAEGAGAGRPSGRWVHRIPERPGRFRQKDGPLRRNGFTFCRPRWSWRSTTCFPYSAVNLREPVNLAHRCSRWNECSRQVRARASVAFPGRAQQSSPAWRPRRSFVGKNLSGCKTSPSGERTSVVVAAKWWC